jgi:tRNA pseudouridine13 synthase
VSVQAHHLAARVAALAPPRAYGAPPAAGTLRAEPEDFVVEENLGFAPAGKGQHVLLKVRKRDANTQWVARELARIAGCRAAEVGYAGLKDRRALAVQWFSVPRARGLPDLSQARGAGFEVLEAHAHTRKLPRGALAGNHFAVRIRAADKEGARLAAALEPRLAQIRQRGVPNYFGPQRFGREGANLDRCRAPLPSLAPQERGFVLSAARSVVFNAVLAARVEDGSWERLLPGELANLDGRGSVFAVEEGDASLESRCRRLEIHPTGPLCGEGDAGTRAVVRDLESRIARQFPQETALCAAAGMRPERRAVRLAVRDLSCACEQGAVLVRFRLARGCFATALLRELIATAADAPDP